MVLRVENPKDAFVPVLVPGTKLGTKPLAPAGREGGMGRSHRWLPGCSTSLNI